MKEIKTNLLKNIWKILKSILLFVIGLLLISIGYSYIFEQDKLAIDKYNFEQLEKVKIAINNDNKLLSNYITDLYNFNYIYKINIKPIKNCYYISKFNGKYPYIFGFKLESVIYKIRYLHWYYYAYPKYDLPVDVVAGMNFDASFTSFMRTISNPCQD